MAVRPNHVFIYGHFTSAPSLLGAILGRPRPDIAIEVLREFSATELVGKVFAKGTGGNWMPVSQEGLGNFTWYKDFSARRELYFVAEGSDPWQVLYFRPESDEAGPYAAVALTLPRR